MRKEKEIVVSPDKTISQKPEGYFYTFGCKLNQAETETLKEQWKEKGGKITKNYFSSELCLINSCVVTQKAEKEVRQKIHQIRKNNPNCILVVVGCFTEKIRKNEDNKVNFWFKNQDKDKIFKEINFSFPNHSQKNNSFKKNKRTRALIKIQSGCQNYCSYCVVPFLRNKIINLTSDDIVQEIKKKKNQGFKEVVLVGTNIGTYFCPKSKIDLAGLLEKILLTGIARIRLSSLWPTHLNNNLIDLIKNNSSICRHLHLAVQSGSNAVLKRMNRHYSEKDLAKIISKLKKIKELNLTADFIVGFPGETKKDFKKTKKLVKKGNFLKIHVFRFSERPGTKAERMENKVSEQIKQKRSQELISIGKKISQKQEKQFLNKEKEVLIEQKRNGYWQGFTKNYLKVFVSNNQELHNSIVRVKLNKKFKNGIIGKINGN